jgi:alkaline phosphatase
MVIALALVGGAAYGQPKAKNVILMISDGGGYGQVDAASLYQNGKTGSQIYDRFKVKLAMCTYMDKGSYDQQKAWSDFNYVSKSKSFTDSAAAATAMSTGVKTSKGAVGLGPDKARLKHSVQIAEKLGKATGVVTSVQISHATPAAFVAHNKSRNNYADIAWEMIYLSGLEVIMGCGHPEYNNDGKPAGLKKEYKYVGGKTVWNDLKDGSVTGTDADGDGVPDKWTVIHEPADFKKLASGPTDPDGFYLMIEGGAIDWAGHDSQKGRIIEEQIGFNEAVEAVVAWVEASSSWSDTLLIVTGDHETGYLTGPGSGTTGGKPVWNPLTNMGKGKAPGMEYHSDGHTNALVPFYAHGVGSDVFTSLARKTDPVRGPYIDNTSIPKAVFTLFGL